MADRLDIGAELGERRLGGEVGEEVSPIEANRPLQGRG